MFILETFYLCYGVKCHLSFPPAEAICDGKCLVLSSFFWQQSFSHTSLHPILTKLGQSYLDHYSHTKIVRGHHGVTGVKNVNFTKNAIKFCLDYIPLTRDLYICNSLTPSTKVMVLKKCPGSFGVTGVKSSFSPKRHQVLQIT